MRNILLLGSSGFIGRNVSQYFARRYNISLPTRKKLDLLDADAVYTYLKKGKFDVVINLATPTGQNDLDKLNEIFERSLRVFINLTHCSDFYGKMIYIGSGAEYGKHRTIINIEENEFGIELPRDPYGLSRYIMNDISAGSNNIYNLRLFGCYGTGDPSFKLIPHVLSCIREGRSIELKQNTLFDFLYVKDVIPVIEYFIENEPKHRAYNLCSGTKIFISEIAAEVRQQMNSNLPIVFKQDGFGFEYTGSNKRLCLEMPKWYPRMISEGIKELIQNENIC